MLPIIISEKILDKLENKHNVSKREIEQCFENLCGVYLEDTREDHKTDPVTLWFVSETNQTRVLKVAFMIKDGSIHIKSAYQPNQQEIRLYEKLGK